MNHLFLQVMQIYTVATAQTPHVMAVATAQTPHVMASKLHVASFISNFNTYYMAKYLTHGETYR